MEALSAAIEKGLVRACHDCSEGGLGVAMAEMAFAGGLGASDLSEISTPHRSAYIAMIISSSPSPIAVSWWK